jgi:hypothetical protein
MLFIQLYISDSAEVYNENINQLNTYLKIGEYDKANLLLNKLQSQTIFNNYELENAAFLLNLKSQYRSKKHYFVNKKIFKALQLFENGKQLESLDFLKKDLSKNSNDTTIVWYEILHHSAELSRFARAQKKQDLKISKVFDEKEAMDLLNLMKNKEKYIQYEL